MLRPVAAVIATARSGGAAALAWRCGAEGIATAMLLAAIVGSGIMGERLAGNSPATVLLVNSLASGAALIAIILAFAPWSGAHLNPIVTAYEALSGRLSARDAVLYVSSQLSGALAGVAIAHAMFSEPLFSASRRARAGSSLWLAEAFATFGLLFVVRGSSRSRPPSAALAVGTYIFAAYWFTSSTSFANPAVTLARAASDTYAGIRLADAPLFVAAQLAGGAAAAFLLTRLDGSRKPKEGETEEAP